MEKDKIKYDNLLISVVVPLYNYKKYIKSCIQSILNQTYKNFELIVVDDFSTDNSYDISKKFEKKDNRIKVIKLDRNYGYSKAKNEGICASRGQYIATLDADDMLTKDSLELRLNATLKHNVSFVYADAIKINGKVRLEECYKINIKKNNKNKYIYDPSEGIYKIHSQSVMTHREIYIKYGLYDENLRARADKEMWRRLFGKDKNDKKQIESFYLNKPVAYYRNHRRSMWRKRKRKKEYDELIIKMSNEAYEMRKKDGINKNNTRLLEK